MWDGTATHHRRRLLSQMRYGKMIATARLEQGCGLFRKPEQD